MYLSISPCLKKQVISASSLLNPISLLIYSCAALAFVIPSTSSIPFIFIQVITIHFNQEKEDLV